MARTQKLVADKAPDQIPALDRLAVRVPEAAQLLSISRAAIYRLLAAGEVQAARSGQKTMVIVASLRDFIERNRVRRDTGANQ